MQAPIPATVLTGFLGSGKTTLLNEILRGAHGLRLAVIVNEFGAVGIDGATIAGGDRFVELDNGCLCCAVNQELEDTLRELADRGGFDQLLIETTGLADPLPLAWTFARPGLDRAFRVDAIVTVFDAADGARVLDEVSEARVQLERADLVVLTKLDLVGDDGAAAEAAVRARNDLAPVLRARPGEAPTFAILSPDAPSRLAGVPEDPGYHHHPSLETVAFQTDDLVSDAALEELVQALPPSVLRAKGLLRTDDRAGWTLVNVVGGRYDLRPLEPERPPARGALVFIGRELDREALLGACRAIVVAPR